MRIMSREFVLTRPRTFQDQGVMVTNHSLSRCFDVLSTSRSISDYRDLVDYVSPELRIGLTAVTDVLEIGQFRYTRPSLGEKPKGYAGRSSEESRLSLHIASKLTMSSTMIHYQS